MHETSDNCGGGATGDATYLLRAILQRGPFQRGEAAFGFIVDPEVVVQATDAGVGATLCDPMATPPRRHAAHPCLMRWYLFRHATLTTVLLTFKRAPCQAVRLARRQAGSLRHARRAAGAQ